MKKKNLFALLLTAILCVSFLIPSVWAGSKQRHRWQGVAIGLGTAILGNAIFKHYHTNTILIVSLLLSLRPGTIITLLNTVDIGGIGK